MCFSDVFFANETRPLDAGRIGRADMSWKRRLEKKNQGKEQNNRLLAMLAVVVVSVAILAAMFCSKNEGQKQPAPSGPDKAQIESHVRSAVNAHLANMKPSEWLLEHSPESINPGLKAACEQCRQSLDRAADAWCPSNELGKAIREWLPRWGWMVGNKVNSEGKTCSAIIIMGAEQVVLLVPHDIAYSVPVDFFCNKEVEGRLVSVKAFCMPDQLLAAFILHEIGHADHYWNGKKAASTAEEVEMHTLSADILDNYSHGKYREEVRNIVNRRNANSLSGFIGVFAELTENDLDKLDQVVGATGVGKDVARSVVVQHLITIGFEAINKNGGTISDKMAMYDWINTLHSKGQRGINLPEQ